MVAGCPRAGQSRATAGDWRVNGRWPFASGCHHADWMLGFCVMTEGGKPLPGPTSEGGPALVRGFFLPARDWSSTTDVFPRVRAAGANYTTQKMLKYVIRIQPSAAPYGTSSLLADRLTFLGQPESLLHQVGCCRESVSFGNNLLEIACVSTIRRVVKHRIQEQRKARCGQVL